MGAAISSVKESLQQDAEKQKQANDALNSLQNLANTKLDAFYTQVTSPHFDSSLIPINKVIDKASFIKCSVSEAVGPIAQEIEELYSDFANGDVGAGISKILGSSLKILFGNYSANSSTMTKYTIACGALGGVYRLDMHMFAYEYTSDQLTSICKNVLAMSIVMSSVNMSNVDDNTLRDIVQKCYSGCTVDEMKKIYEQIKSNTTGFAGNAAVDGALSTPTRAVARPSRHPPGTKPPHGDYGPKIRQVQYSATASVTLPIGSANESAEAVAAYVIGALRRVFRRPQDLVVLTSNPEDDTADQQLLVSVNAVRLVIDDGDGFGADDDMLLIREMDDALHYLVDSDSTGPVELDAYRFLVGADDDTPAESSLMKFRYPRLLAARETVARPRANGARATVE